LAEIAVELERALARRVSGGEPGTLSTRLLAHGDGWTVEDVICTSGPQDRPFEEQHSRFRIAIVAAGGFQYRSQDAREVMTPGSLLLGHPGHCFECGHEHGTGDRCLSFGYDPDFIDRMMSEGGMLLTRPAFDRLRLPPLRALAPLVARACSAVAGPAGECVAAAWEELSIQLAARALQLTANGTPGPSAARAAAQAQVTRVARQIDADPTSRFALADLAQEAGLSSYHFLRTFERVIGVTPHQYVMRARLRQAAIRLVLAPDKILDVALDCGFGDVSNFNHAFRAEFGVSPRLYRKQMGLPRESGTSVRVNSREAHGALRWHER
jgi:AraC family transcriptional regulator